MHKAMNGMLSDRPDMTEMMMITQNSYPLHVQIHVYVPFIYERKLTHLAKMYCVHIELYYYVGYFKL